MIEKLKPFPARSPADELDYAFQFGAWLQAGETIVDKTVTVTAGNTVVDRVVIAGTDVVFWLSGGSAARTTHAIRCTIRTSAGREYVVSTTIAVWG